MEPRGDLGDGGGFTSMGGGNGSGAGAMTATSGWLLLFRERAAGPQHVYKFGRVGGARLGEAIADALGSNGAFDE